MIRFISALTILICAAAIGGCAEATRATSGFQPFTPDPPPEAVGVGFPGPVRLSYNESLKGRVCVYARVVDQDGTPVANALVKVWVTNRGSGRADVVTCRTTTDAEGRFSVLGGRATRVGVSIIKPGYTPANRGGPPRVNSPEAFRGMPDQPLLINAWKNTGSDPRKLIWHRPIKRIENGKSGSVFRLTPPLPPFVRFDLVKGVRVLDEASTEWDVQITYAIDEHGHVPRELWTVYDGNYARDTTIAINQGKMVYVSDPLPGFERFGDGYIESDVPGILERALKAESIPYLQRAENQMFLFSSRGGKVHGACNLINAKINGDGGADPMVYSIVNPTGSPALNEREPTAGDLNVEGFPLAE